MSALVTLGVGIRYGRRALAELDGHMALVAEAGAARAQVEELFAMTDMLQAADDHEDAGAVLMASAARLLPDLDGALYVFNNSRDRLDLARSWSARDGFAPPPALFPKAAGRSSAASRTSTTGAADRCAASTRSERPRPSKCR
nr:hypothetical protein [Novosphingobium panipatense]